MDTPFVIILGPAETRRRAIEAQSNADDVDRIKCCISKLKELRRSMTVQFAGAGHQAALGMEAADQRLEQAEDELVSALWKISPNEQVPE